VAQTQSHYTIGSAYNVDLGWVETREGPQSVKYASDCRYLDPFQRYSRSNSDAVWNRAEFWTLCS